MSEANKSLMLSEAEIIEAINSDSLISVSLGAGQPQKNVKMSTLASVAAGLIGIVSSSKDGLMPKSGFMYRGNGGTLSGLITTTSGIYNVTGTSDAQPLTDWGMLIVFGGSYPVQLFFPCNSGSRTVFFKRVHLNGVWQNWVKYSGSNV